MTHPLVKAIQNCVVPHPKPCVNISGGLDSTIILHHLHEKTTENIHTYTLGFEGRNEFKAAQQVADHYGTIHHEVTICNMLSRFREILKVFKKPRFNLWPFWLAEQASKDGRRNCYIGEGGDEHFGGYWYKPQSTYLEHWAGFFTYVYPTYRTVYRHFGVQLHCPMHPMNLYFHLTLPYYDMLQEKSFLRKAYKNILPKFVLKKRKQNGRFDYWVMWRWEIQPYFPDARAPETEDDIRELLNAWATRTWSELHHGAMLVEVLVPQ